MKIIIIIIPKIISNLNDIFTNGGYKLVKIVLEVFFT